MKNIFKGTAIIASGLLIAAAAAGTFALWNDSSTVDGGEIFSGNLDLNVINNGWEDVSLKDGSKGSQESLDKVTASGPITDISDFRIVPGDTVIGTYDVSVALEGEHALADLLVDFDNTPTIPEGFEIDYRMNSGDWTSIDTDGSILFYSPDYTDEIPASAVPANNLAIDGSEAVDVTVELRVYFNNSATGSMQSELTLSQVNFALTQVRGQSEEPVAEIVNLSYSFNTDTETLEYNVSWDDPGQANEYNIEIIEYSENPGGNSLPIGSILPMYFSMSVNDPILGSSNVSSTDSSGSVTIPSSNTNDVNYVVATVYANSLELDSDEANIVRALNGITKVSVGHNNSAALGDNGEVYVWGENSIGQLGLNSTDDKAYPQSWNSDETVLRDKTIVDITKNSDGTLVLTDEGELYYSGHIGSSGIPNYPNGSIINEPTLVPVLGSSLENKTIVSIYSGYKDMYAIDSDGVVHAWGLLPFNSPNNTSVPIELALPSSPMFGKEIIQIESTTNFALALDSEGNVYAWGRNNYGQLGNNSTTNSINNPVLVQTPSELQGKNIIDISVSEASGFILTDDNSLYSWGHNQYGTLGIGSYTEPILVPTLVDFTGTPMDGEVITNIDSHGRSVVVSTSNNRIFMWGLLLDDGQYSYSYGPVEFIFDNSLFDNIGISSINVGEGYALIHIKDGRIYSWGYNYSGQLGNRNINSVPTYDLVQVNLF